VQPGTALFDIHPEDCADLLASATLGRLAVVVDGRPEIFPVNHLYDRDSGSVIFPADIGTDLHAVLSSSWVAFEADGVAADGSRGWSVLVVGRAEEIVDGDLIAELSTEQERLWRTGATARWIRVVPSKVTGRRICAADRPVTLRGDPW
jgi:uncharacterized protein